LIELPNRNASAKLCALEQKLVVWVDILPLRLTRRSAQNVPALPVDVLRKHYGLRGNAFLKKGEGGLSFSAYFSVTLDDGGRGSGPSQTL